MMPCMQLFGVTNVNERLGTCSKSFPIYPILITRVTLRVSYLGYTSILSEISREVTRLVELVTFVVWLQK